MLLIFVLTKNLFWKQKGKKQLWKNNYQRQTNAPTVVSRLTQLNFIERRGKSNFRKLHLQSLKPAQALHFVFSRKKESHKLFSSDKRENCSLWNLPEKVAYFELQIELGYTPAQCLVNITMGSFKKKSRNFHDGEVKWKMCQGTKIFQCFLHYAIPSGETKMSLRVKKGSAISVASRVFH